MLPIPFARDRLLTRGTSMLRASKVLFVVSIVVSVGIVAAIVWMVDSGGPVILFLPLLALSLGGLYLAPKRVRDLRLAMAEKATALDAMERAGQTEVAVSFVEI